MERTLDLGIKVTLVNGDITDHLDWLLWNDASVITRGRLMDNILSNCCWLQFKAVNLQPKWEYPLISKLIWSGTESTPDITLKLLELSKGPVAATIVHGDATIEQLKEQLANYDGAVEHLIIFHKDEYDYAF